MLSSDLTESPRPGNPNVSLSQITLPKTKVEAEYFQKAPKMTISYYLKACFDDDRQFSPKATDDEDKTLRISDDQELSGRKKRGGRGHFSRTQTQSLFPVRRSLEIISRLAPISARSHTRPTKAK